ncbi:YggT family protein [Marinactinospora thermotolerans]|uniref:YggT family protein n=1 Tax=Marinactinospora thermotolerans DSM 45154 TaxID=1122192 RepID=A0A1T4KVH7_9ACTN|nr:YggT family protein [Marinactinospora thermotolerans]SJZ46380.1 YggT family protein [Marinactinospora thermotolerans DSM 45154]
MSIVQNILITVLYLFMLVLIGRLVFEIVQSFARSWRPTGFVLVLAESTYTITDPPLKLLRRFIKPVRLGSVALDLSFTVLFLLVVILIQLVATIPIV